MLLQENTITSEFSDQLKKQLDAVRTGDEFKTFREKAWDHFLELGLPEKKGAYQYVPLRQLYSSSFARSEPKAISFEEIKSYVYPESQESLIVFVNGVFNADLSRLSALPKQVVIAPLTTAMRSYGAHLQSRFSKLLQEERDPFVVLNSALQNGGVFIYIPPKTKLKAPIQYLNIIASGTSIIASPRVQLFVGAQSEVEWIANAAVLSDEASFVNGVVDIAMEEGASCRYTSLLQTQEDSWYFDAVRATLKRDSSFNSFTVSSGSKSVRQDFRMTLLGENAEAKLQGIAMLEKNLQAHTHVLMEHAAPYTRSMQRFKVVLEDVSQSSFEGKIYVQSCAQKTEAYQLNNNLILGERAIAYSKPNLEVFADDVKASHGATVSELAKEPLFYLKTRGIAESDAKALLVQGFCKEIIDQIPQESVRCSMNAFAKSFFK